MMARRFAADSSREERPYVADGKSTRRSGPTSTGSPAARLGPSEAIYDLGIRDAQQRLRSKMEIEDLIGSIQGFLQHGKIEGLRQPCP